jgi:hypothetical protein
MMNVAIQIYYHTSDSSVLRRGNFPLKGKVAEKVAYDFWKWIKGEHDFHCELEKVVCDGEDITEKVAAMIRLYG